MVGHPILTGIVGQDLCIMSGADEFCFCISVHYDILELSGAHLPAVRSDVWAKNVLGSSDDYSVRASVIIAAGALGCE